MNRQTIALGKVLGIPVALDYSWFLVFALITWTLAAGYYPAEFPGWAVGTYWLLGAVTAAATFYVLMLTDFRGLQELGFIAGTAILLDTGLNYLGMGLPPPTPTWGDLLREAQQWYSTAPWLVIWPGLAVVVTVAAVNLIAFDLQRAPR